MKAHSSHVFRPDESGHERCAGCGALSHWPLAEVVCGKPKRGANKIPIGDRAHRSRRWPAPQQAKETHAMMFDLKEGQEVHVMRTGGAPIPATVLSVELDRVLIRDGETGKRRSVDRKRVMVAPAPPPPGKLSRVPNYDMAGGEASPKAPPSRSARYLAFVREQSCCACAAPGPSDPHHWALKGKGGGMGTKADDFRTVPLCRLCHDYYHAHAQLPECTIIMTRMLFLATQVDLLIKWAIREGKV